MTKNAESNQDITNLLCSMVYLKSELHKMQFIKTEFFLEQACQTFIREICRNQDTRGDLEHVVNFVESISGLDREAMALLSDQLEYFHARNDN